VCPEVEKGHTDASWSTGWRWKLGIWAEVRAWKRNGNLKLGDNFCQIQSPEAIFTLFSNEIFKGLGEN